jgi:ABC-2 type transport system permease protein
MTRLLSIAWKEIVQLRRDRLTAGMMIGLPVMQLILFAWAINTDVRHIPTVVLDYDRSAASRAFGKRMEATGSYDLVGEVASYDEIGRALRSGKARVALVVPPGFGAGKSRRMQLVVDGTDPQTVASATQTAGALAGAGAIAVEGITVEPVTWYNPDLRTVMFLVPGLIGVILTMTMVMFTSMAIARERERGTLEQLIVTPVRRWELIVGKIAPYVLVGYFQMTLVLTIGRWVFDVPIVGSLPLLYLLAFGFIAANLALGLFFSTIAKTQQQAMQLSFFFLLPNILLSGFAFPWEGMPKAAQWLSQALPLTHFLRVARGIVLKGSGLREVGMEMVWLLAILGGLIGLALLRFRKKLG